MAIGRQTLRTAIVLTCTALSLPAFSPLASSQTPPPVENPQAAKAANDGQSRDSDQQRQRDQAGDQKGGDQKDADEQGRAEEGAAESRGRRFPGRGRRMREAFAQEAELEQPKAWLGIGLKEVSGDLAAYLGSTKGVLVESVFPDSPAEAAGIKVGDLIVEINGQRVANPPALIEALVKLERSRSQDSGKRDQDDDQKDKGRQRRKDADQKADADRNDGDDEKEKDADKKDVDKKDADKKDSDKQRGSDKKQSTYPTVHLKILRQGKEMTVDVTPTERPESLAVAAQQAEQPEQQPGGGVSELNRRQLEQLLEEMQRQGGGGRMFRFGLPPGIRQQGTGSAEEQVENVVIVVKDAEGHAAEVRIQRVGDQPPKIMVREGGKTRQLSEEEVEQLPEPVRDAVEQAIKQMEEERATRDSDRDGDRDADRDGDRDADRDGDRGAQGGPRGPRERFEAARRFREGLRMGPGGQGILHPEELRELGRYAAELAAAYQHMAEETARRGVQKAQDYATLPDELKELQSQVDELKKQVEELQKQAKPNQ